MGALKGAPLFETLLSVSNKYKISVKCRLNRKKIGEENWYPGYHTGEINLYHLRNIYLWLGTVYFAVSYIQIHPWSQEPLFSVILVQPPSFCRPYTLLIRGINSSNGTGFFPQVIFRSLDSGKQKNDFFFTQTPRQIDRFSDQQINRSKMGLTDQQIVRRMKI